LKCVSESKILSDCQWHEFDISKSKRVLFDGIHLCETDRNGAGYRQLHIGGFVLSGGVFGPPDIIRRVISPLGYAEASPGVFPNQPGSPAVIPELAIFPAVVSELAIFPDFVLNLVISPSVIPELAMPSVVVEERTTPDETVQKHSETQSLDWAAEHRIDLAENPPPDSNDLENPESEVSSDAKVGV
jgi:hypothetical protein